MEIIIDQASNLWQIIESLWIVKALKVFLAIYVAVLVVDIVLVVIMLDPVGSVRKNLRGVDIPLTRKKTYAKQWAKIMMRLDGENESQYKVAVLEADQMADGILEKIGYKGTNIGERLQNATNAQLDYYDDILRAHYTRNQIVHDESYVIDKDKAHETLEIYEKFMRGLELF
ncbi:MAG: hypothetical protein KC736_00745 [Candidatus Moranbacteria bacterium]|nr:hypothetical protein [Candidatus Moranbacteria bacterium]